MLASGTKEPGNGGKEQAAGGTMRLTCPNCGAQYEVPEAVIPEAGRDVQCSNCGTTWFQHHPDHAPPEPPEPPETDTMPDPDPEPDPGPDPEPASGPKTTAETAAAAQRRLDPSVADILREEADRERAARAAEADGRIETQADLGLTEPGRDEARDQMQRPRAAPPADGGPGPRGTPDTDVIEERAEDAGDRGARRHTLFPDIEEINSSLSASDDSTAAPATGRASEPSLARRGSGFRTGFRFAVVSCVVALVVYLMAPWIAGLWPAAEAPLAQYVQAVDAGRAVLSATVTETVTALLARF